MRQSKKLLMCIAATLEKNKKKTGLSFMLKRENYHFHKVKL